MEKEKAICVTKDCDKNIDLDKDNTWCGYGRCVDCCRKLCGHRTHQNLEIKK